MSRLPSRISCCPQLPPSPAPTFTYDCATKENHSPPSSLKYIGSCFFYDISFTTVARPPSRIPCCPQLPPSPAPTNIYLRLRARNIYRPTCFFITFSPLFLDFNQEFLASHNAHQSQPQQTVIYDHQEFRNIYEHGFLLQFPSCFWTSITNSFLLSTNTSTSTHAHLSMTLNKKLEK